MLRFCDREVDCIEYCSLSDSDALNRADMLMYFLQERKDAVVCVYDDFNSMEFLGIITYQSLNSSLTFRGSIQTECFVLDENIWENARMYFKKHAENSGENFVIPVINQNGELICFAYGDLDANREIRQLHELSEMPEALQFADIYPEYKCVKIHECNELAYYFAKYLESQNIAVQVEGVMWQGFFDGEACQVPDYECLHIYAEGTWEKSRNWKENLLRSVSVEFECVDRIYEANIRNNVIGDSDEDCAELLAYLRKEKEIVLCGTNREEQNAYDYLKGNGIEICGFIGVENKEYGHTLFGKRIMSSIEARAAYQNAVFIECKAQNSAWGFGRTDFYDYIGYRRNERFILLRDYIEVPENNIINILKNRKIALVGDFYLCDYLADYLRQKEIPVKGYLSTLSEEIDTCKISSINAEDIDEKTTCLLVLSQSVWDEQDINKRKKKEEQIVRKLNEWGIHDYSAYFGYMNPFVNIEWERDYTSKYTKEWLKPKKIVLGSIEFYNGNGFFRGLLDNHPEILVMDYNYLNYKLFWICIRLSMEDSTNILSVFYNLMEEENVKIDKPTLFNKKMNEMLAYSHKFTSQEIFVMIHVAFLSMYDRNINILDIKNMVIFWEPHYVRREMLEECTKWLGTEEVPCDIINVVRNICMQVGSGIKSIVQYGLTSAYYMALKYPPIDKKVYAYSNRVVVKFEDLKCSPKETLMDICKRWEISWDDTLMHVTRYGKARSWNNYVREVRDFDLEPVYNTYERFFSAFDRFRIQLINAPWQRKYGYPYVEISQFTRKELQEMFLKSFRFDNLGDTEEHKDGLQFRIWLQMSIREKLQRTRMIEITEYDYFSKIGHKEKG